MELLKSDFLGQKLHAKLLIFCALVWGLFCNGFVIDLEIESQVNLTSASKRFPFELNAVDANTQNREKVIDYLSRSIVQEKLLVKWQMIKDDGLRKTTLGTNNKITREEFVSSNKLTLKEVLNYLQFFPLLYKDALEPIDFHIPIDGIPFIVTLRHDGSGSFTAVLGANDLSDINAISTKLNDAFDKINKPINLPNLILAWSRSALNSVDNYKKHFPTDYVKPDAQDAFLKGMVFLLSTSILRKQVALLTPIWLKNLNNALDSERSLLENELANSIKAEDNTKLKYELTANMLKRSNYYQNKWTEMITFGDMVVSKFKKQVPSKVTVNPTHRCNLRELFKLLQYFPYFNLPKGKVRFEVPIGGATRAFYLGRAFFGSEQILIYSHDADWPNTKKKVSNKFTAPAYNTIINQLKGVPNQKLVAFLMRDAADSKLDNQRSFENFIEAEYSKAVSDRIIRPMVEFLVITMVAEAAAPADAVKELFVTSLAGKIFDDFPMKDQMPELGNLGVKSGRSPTMDDVVLGMLDDMITRDVSINKMFSETNFPIRKYQGTQEGRVYLYENGDKLIPSYLIQKSANAITTIARKSSTGSK